MSRATPGLIVGWLLVSLLSGCDFAGAQADRQVAEGLALVQAGRYSEGVTRFEQAIATKPTHAQAHYLLGVVRLQHLNAASRSVENLQRASELSPRDAEAAYQLGVAYQQTEQRIQAIEAFRSAASRDPQHAGAHYRLGVMYEATGDYMGAIEAFSRAIQADPEMALAYSRLANIYVMFGERETGLAVLNVAAQYNPDDGSVRADMGRIAFDAQDYHGAIRELERAVELGEQQPGTMMTLGLSYLRRHERSGDTADRERALNALQRAAAGCNPQRDGGRCAAIGELLSELRAPQR